MVTFTGNSVGDTATYSCDSGFELIGGATTTCALVSAISAAFSPEPPSCRREYCMNVTGLVSCVPSSLCESYKNNSFPEEQPVYILIKSHEDGFMSLP